MVTSPLNALESIVHCKQNLFFILLKTKTPWQQYVVVYFPYLYE